MRGGIDVLVKILQLLAVWTAVSVPISVFAGFLLADRPRARATASIR